MMKMAYMSGFIAVVQLAAWLWLDPSLIDTWYVLPLIIAAILLFVYVVLGWENIQLRRMARDLRRRRQ